MLALEARWVGAKAAGEAGEVGEAGDAGGEVATSTIAGDGGSALGGAGAKPGGEEAAVGRAGNARAGLSAGREHTKQRVEKKEVTATIEFTASSS